MAVGRMTIAAPRGGSLSLSEVTSERLRWLGPTAIAAYASSDEAARGARYARRGNVASVQAEDDRIRGVVEGSHREPYRTVVRVDATGIEALCTCAYDGGWCKHVVATILQTLEPQVTRRKSARRRPPAKPAQPVRVRLKRRRELPAFRAERTRRQVWSILHQLDRLRPSEAYWHVGDVTHELEAVRAEAEARIEGGDLASGFEQLGVLTDEVCSAWKVLDDSDGLVGDFARDLGGTWMRCLLRPDVAPLMRRRNGALLAKWEKAYADYGVGESFAGAVAAARSAWKVDGPPELVAVKLDLLEQSGDEERFLELALRVGEIRRYALCQIRRGDVDAALAPFEKASHCPRETLDVAEALHAAGKTARALSFALQMAQRPQPPPARKTLWGEHDWRISIARWAAETAERSGDVQAALQAAARRFDLDIDVEEYRRIERLAAAQWPSYREALLNRARRCKEREAIEAIAVLLDAACLEDALRRFDARPMWAAEATVWRLFARAAEEAPGWAIERATHVAEDIMDRAERGRYETAVRWLRFAAFAFRSDGREVEWTAYRGSLLTKHRNKRALVPLILALR
jgi:tetratricopeptide (TPR) repeat protein